MASKGHMFAHGIGVKSVAASARIFCMVRPGWRVVDTRAGRWSSMRPLSGTTECDGAAPKIELIARERSKPLAHSVFWTDPSDTACCDVVGQRKGQFEFVVANDGLELA